jgi:DNA-binding NtrC family response regulator
MVLNQSGYEARAVYKHAAAISAAREFEPDVFLTGFVNDCEVNGCQTAAEALTFLPECRVIIFSGTSSAGPVIEDFRRRGYDFAVLAKPLHPHDLLEQLRSYGPPPVPKPIEPLPILVPRKAHKFRSLLKRRSS